MSKDNEQDSTPYVPKTNEERNEAFGLLDELLNELGTTVSHRELKLTRLSS